jgi:hypothetical protein
MAADVEEREKEGHCGPRTRRKRKERGEEDQEVLYCTVDPQAVLVCVLRGNYLIVSVAVVNIIYFYL